jgi:hypothetical protein
MRKLRHFAFPLIVTCLAFADVAAYEPVPTGDHRYGYLSPVDGSLQFYHVYVPAFYDPTQPTPVVFSLHGFGGRTGPAGGGLRGRWADANAWLLVRPDGRGNQNWDGIGEDDIFHVLADMRRSTPDHAAFNVDGERLYVEGFSMGGHGAFRLATRHAGTFAAVAPVAGWTTHREFYRHWYDTSSPDLGGGYIDPARMPLLETASSLKQAENALWCPVFATYDLNDGINPPSNARDMIRRIRGVGGVHVTCLEGTGGHCGSYDIKKNLRFFRGKTLNRWPRTVRLTTNTLRHNRAHWITIERLRVLNQWARAEADVDEQRVTVTCRNVLAFGLDLDPELVDMDVPVKIQIDGREPIETEPRPRLSFEARLNDHLGIAEWMLVDQPGDDAVSDVRKTHELAGPIDDAFRSRFTVIYGAQPGSRRVSIGADRDDALRFAAEWNGWMTLHWGNQRPSGRRRADWWQQPYPFQPGRHVHPDTLLVTPRPDTDFTLESLPDDRNLVLFGDPGSNWIVAHLAERLPIRVTLDSVTGVNVQCGARVYSGDHVNYFFIAPNPLAPRHYVVLARGYLSSGIDANRSGARQVGKDMEALPFYWPDYVIWDARRRPGPTVQAPLRYLPDAFLDAGYFGEDWQLCRRAPVPCISVEGEKIRREDAWYSPARVRISANAVPGGFGVAGIEYKVNSGAWTPYRESVSIAAEGHVIVSARTRCDNGQYIYLPQGSTVRGVAAPGNMSDEGRVCFEVQERRSLWRRFKGLFGKRRS